MGTVSQKEPVAIIGAGLRLPGADTLDEFWEHLAAERSLIAEVPAERWDAGALKGNPAKGNKTNSIWGGFVDHADCFDAEFFGISPREAAWMDPQQRFALEMAWQAIEDGGYRASELAGSRTGVFMGVCHWDYAELLEKHLATVDAYLPTGIAFSIIANRVSHFFDFHGPSITNDTACAASMTSIYEAVRALQDGTCDLALAGGVNLIWSPNHFVAFSKAGMLSKDGKSKAFDDAADGYVRGEGGAVLLLKPLAKALEDNDPIHAVIKGIGINHGGRTNSLTVTSPEAQADLIKQVHREAAVSPGTVDYVEAHGPGTPLGDPIEITGLKEAFADLAEETGTSFKPETCGIGSVKTNIGHLEGAAGVAGIIKVLAALKHGQLPANVGFQEENRLIDLSGSPFRIQKNQTDWSSGQNHPRRACVSSFGFGGSNGHVLLEEAPGRDHVAKQTRKTTFAVPLSAANSDRLAEYGARLLRFVEDLDPKDVTLADIAHTCQAAREAMDARCVFLVADLNELADTLREFLIQGGDEESILPNEAAGKASAKPLKIRDVAKDWVEGQPVDWAKIQRGPSGRRCHLPVYPFERQRHWMDLSLGAKDQKGPPHPLLHRNTSGFNGCSFETQLTGNEFVLADHHVGGKQILPGVAVLEMARAASELAGGQTHRSYILENIVWSKPVQLENRQAVTIETKLEQRDRDRIEFQVGTPGSDKNNSNATGTIRFQERADCEAQDLGDLKHRIAEPFEIATCYDWLQTSGVDHGPAFRALSKVSRSGQDVLAQIKLPRRLMASLEAMPLHPVVLDAAIQAWVAAGNAPPDGAGVPFACKEIEVHGACEMVMWAHVRLREGRNQKAPVRYLDIDVMDRDGVPKIVFRDLALRILGQDQLQQEPEIPVDQDIPLIVTDGGWQDVPLEIREGNGPERCRLLLAGGDEELQSALSRNSKWSVDVLPDVAGLGEAEAGQRLYQAAVTVVRDCLATRSAEPVNTIVLATEKVPDVVVAPLAGLLKTAAIESPKMSGRVVSVAGKATPGRLQPIATAEFSAADTLSEVRYDAKGLRSAWLPVSNTATDMPELFQADPDGVYWITGGLGGLGRIFADWLVSKGAGKLLLTGRRDTPSADDEAWLADLRNAGTEARYRPCDVSDLADVERVADRAAQEFGPLKGIIHAAGVLDDGYIRLQEPEAAARVFAPKVAGAVNLDQAAKGQDLDFFLLCSSIASVFGTAGQAAYASANAFLDAFAERRSAQVSAGSRNGKTVAVAWPLWADGGMSVDAATLVAMKKRLGLTPLPSAAGLQALETILTGQGAPRSTVLHGDLERIDEVLADYGQAPVADETETEAWAEPERSEGEKAAIDRESLKRKTVDFVRDILADVLEMDASRIRANRKLEEYGLDSIAIVESTSRLEEAIGPLSKTLFFEFVDLDGVAGHLVEDHGPALQSLLAEEVRETPRAVAAANATAEIMASQPVQRDSSAAEPKGDREARHDIAIVGLSLHVSKADDQNAFWKMLSEGIDGFEPVPSDRWDHGALHHGERDILGKTVVKTGAFLKDIDKFDPRYFRISQAEAELMSPEVRLFLQASVEAFEDAGYSRETMTRRYGGDVAVIMGSMTNEYDLYGFQNMLMRGSLASGSYTGTVPNMVSYYYGFTGPSYFLDTMCSASSTCVHEAVHMLRAGRCKMALAGGVSLLLHPQKLIATSQEHFTTKSADVIRGYGLGAEGTILGEGVGALVLKPLADAERDGDHIYGVITGTGISNAGVRNGFTVPNPNQQAVAIEHALDDAGISPETIGYIEGHGSGTALGDPIEVKALTQVFRKHTDAVQSCPIGTVKSNVAHLLGASGLAGITKVLAQLKHGQLAPSLHADTLNPDIPFETSPFYVQRELSPWTRLIDETGAELPRRAGVTSIGAGGMNSHIIIEEYHEPVRPAAQEEPDLLVFSALTPDRLKEVLKRFAAFLKMTPDLRLSDAAYTLQTGKNELSCRIALIAGSASEALSAIESFLAAEAPTPGMTYVPSILEVDPPEDQDALTDACAARQLADVGTAWCHGAPVDWDLLNQGRDVRRISLPAYPFEKIRCWYNQEPDAPSVINPIGSRSKLHPFIGENRSDVTGLRYSTSLHLKELRDYVYLDGGRETVLPIVAAEISCAAARLSGIAETPRLSRLEILSDLVWPEVRDLNITVEQQGHSGHSILIDVVTGTGNLQRWALAEVEQSTAGTAETLDLDALKHQSVEILDHKTVYDRLKGQRLSFAPYLEPIEELRRLTDGGLQCTLKTEPLQQDFFKKNICCPAPALGAAFELLRLAEPDVAEASLRSFEGVQFGEGGITGILCSPKGNGTYSLRFLDDEGRIVGDIATVSLSNSESVAARAVVESETSRGGENEADALQKDLREKAAEILKFSAAAIGLREAFHDLGFDSISLARYANDIGLSYGIELSPAIFFECEHIEAVAEYLINRHGVTVAASAKQAPAAKAVPAAAGAADVVASRRVAQTPATPVRAAPEMTGQNGPADTRIAVIGMAGRCPRSPDVEIFFDHLLAGDDLTGDLPLGRYSQEYARRLREAGFTKRGGFLEDIDRFDAAFFKISPVEAERLDPQQRLLLETSWRTLENAGYTPQDLPRDTGVFIGITSLDYAELWRSEGLSADGYVATGNSLAMAANRLSHQFDIHGPSQAIDTACSSSLIAMLRARDALLSGKCSAAIAGGVNLCLSLDGFEGPHQAGMLSPTGHCHTFGQAADGYTRGEGVATLLLKRLSDAERDGDRILGVIAGGAENHGGRSGALTAPNAKAQARLITEAMQGIDPKSVSYIEAHGTGTELGDPVEINGLRRAYSELLGGEVDTAPWIGLGTVKSGIGHLEAAAGIAGVIKVLMAMRRNELPPTLYSEPVSPHIDLDGSPFRIVTDREAWMPESASGPRRAGVSSFGFGGTNAHIVLESYDRVQDEARAPLAPHQFAATRYWLPTMETTGTGRDKMLFQAGWEPVHTKPSAPFNGRRVAVDCGVRLSSSPALTVRDLQLTGASIAARYAEAAVQLLEILRQEMAAPGNGAILIQLAVPADGENAFLSGLTGMLQTAHQEDPRIHGQIVEIPAGTAPAQASAWLEDAGRDPGQTHVRYIGGKCEIRRWTELPEMAAINPWRDGGVYLITGGMGGLGRLLARHIAERARNAVIVLTGSKPLDDERTEVLSKLKKLGAVTAYRQVDVTDPLAVKNLVDHIIEVHGSLNGVFHCAGVLRDGYIAGKSGHDLKAVLAPKVEGAIALGEACTGLTLDAFVLFSSLAGPFGNSGQACYAAANGFLDAYAHASGGRITALDWPLWVQGGMSVDEAVKEALYRRMGQRPLDTQAGLAALDQVLAAEAAQVAVVGGDEARIRDFFAASEPKQAAVPAVSPQNEPCVAPPSGQLEDKVSGKLRALFSQLSGVAESAMDPQTPLEDYGIDSLMITKLNNGLDTVFEKLPKTLFFRYRTLRQVSEYLAETQPAACQAWVGDVEKVTRPEVPATQTQNAVSTPSVQQPHMQPSSAGQNEPIAIIGMSGTYPGAADLDNFWENLREGRDVVQEIPAERWALGGFFEADPDKAVAEGKSYAKWGAFLDGFADFDPLFFNLSPRDAAAMDPQERLFLMSAWQAIEDGGYTRSRLKAVAGTEHGGARVGVFAGVTKTGYALYGPFRSEGGAVVRPSTSFASIANRVSHIFDLSGPSLPVDTMCSSSLSAIHQACEQLRSGNCAMALAGGVNLYLHPSNFVELSAARMLSPTGRCRSFGAGGDGFVPGEGVGCILLKPLSRAQADGDRIHAVIRASAVNHGGRTNGYTVPSPDAQRDVIRMALDRSGLSPSEISYIEAHGTGTDLGDPIEVDGLTQALGDGQKKGGCALGSVKSSIGHLEAAAGIAGLTKVVLQMKNRTLVPSLHAEQINPNNDLEETPFTLQRQASPWSSPTPRRAGISSFGAGGANAHVIVEEWPAQDQVEGETGSTDRPQLILLSAQDTDRLKDTAARLLEFLRKPAQPVRGTSKEKPSPASLQNELGRILGIAPAEIDPDEDFDALGLDASHIPHLQSWCETVFGHRPSPAELDMAGSINGLLMLFADKGGEQATGRTAPDLADIAYTLQIGREAMDCRLAFVATGMDELQDALDDWLSGRDPSIPLAVSHQNSRKSALGALADDEVIQDVIKRAWETGRIETVARLWVEGVNVAWDRLNHEPQRHILSLPTYPFAKNRYWLPESLIAPKGKNIAADAKDDPLGVRQVIDQKTGDAALLEESEILDKAISGVLAAILKDIPGGDVIPRYQKWLTAARSLLSAQGDQGSGARAWTQWERIKNSAASKAQFVLAEAALRSLPEILTGAKQATEVLFPDGRQSLVEAVYKENRVAARFSGTVAEAARQIVGAEKDLGRPVRILEIGAGTGGTSEPVFDALQPYQDRIGEYAYTDVSRAFLIHAERNYGNRIAGLKPVLLDIEQPLSGQDVEPGAYDIVIAANVLHATADIYKTLAHVREILRPGGVLLLNETTSPTFFTHVTFGLLDGWWRFVDGDRRIPGSPSLAPESWRRALEASGFDWICCSSAEEQALGQQIIAAKAAGEQASILPVAITSETSETSGGAGAPLREILFQALGETLNMAPSKIDPEHSFADYGLDSILGAEFVHSLRKNLDIEIDQTALFDFTNAAKLLTHLQSAYPEITASKKKTVSVLSHAAPAARDHRSDERLHDVRASDPASEPIAIVGASGRFAKSPTMDDLWTHLAAGRDLVEPVSRFDLSPFYKDAEPGSYGSRGSFLDHADRFDPVFFGISGVEATYMDPQQRLFLEEAWKTLESAGHAGEDMIGRRCGVFVGCAHGDYQELFDEQPPGQAFWGNTTSLIPARISYWLDLKGPAVAIDTACSSSLVALHSACQSIRNGDCDMALAGGVFVQCSPRFFRYANAAGMLSPSGRCAAFGAGADGIVPGEAVGAVLLRPLKEALADGDTILGIVAASGINQDGTTNGITAPSAASQERLIRQVYEENGIGPDTIDFVEAHGTGTVLGDPIEHAALVRAFAGNKAGPVYLGSVKSNIGHATTAAGIAGLAKILLSLGHEQIPPTIHFGDGNPGIDFGSGPFEVNTQPVSWQKVIGKTRRAAISSFGFGGTNAHAVIDEAPERAFEREPADSHLFVLSARTADQLRSQAENLAAYLDAHPELLAEDVAFTLMAGRRAMGHRLALVATDLASVSRSLRAWLDGRSDSGVDVGEGVGAGNGEGQPPVKLAASSGAARIADLKELGRKFLAGASVDASSVFMRQRRRVPLPTYPFAKKSYWVTGIEPTEKQEVQVQRQPAPPKKWGPPVKPVAPVSAPAIKRPITLAKPAALAAVSERDIVRSEKVVLPPLAATPAKAPEAGCVSAETPADGVCVLTLSGCWGDQQADELVQALADWGTRETVRAIVVTLAETWDSIGNTSKAFDPASFIDCPVPVVVSVSRDIPGQVGEMALAADFLVAGQDKAFDGEERQGILRVPSGQEDGSALDLARDIARGPRQALVLLKRHMRVDLPQKSGGLPASPAPLQIEASSAGTEPHTSTPVALKTDVMRLELFEDGVALVTMLERSGHNMFTPDFMDGLEEVFAKIASLAEAKVVVLTGHDSYFACGGTKEGLDDLQQGGSRFTDRRIYTLPLECGLPVIAAMQGHAIGAGWSLGMYCDRTILASEAVYQSNYLLLGFTPGAGATLIFPHKLGDDLGREVLFSARQYRGQELARRSPQVTSCPARDVLGHALAEAHAMARLPREQLRTQKEQQTERLRGCLNDVLDRELAMHEKTFIGNPDVKQRIADKFSGQGSPTKDVEVENAIAVDRSGLKADLIASLASDLMIDASDIRPEDTFLDLGLDSILAVTWIRNLNKRFDISLPATAVYAHPTVQALTDHIAGLVQATGKPQLAASTTAEPDAEPAKPPVQSDRPKAVDQSLRNDIVASLAQALMIEPDEISDQSGFLDLGLDSILAVTWIRALNKRHNINLPATAVYAHPSVGALIEHIAGLIPAPASAPETPRPEAAEDDQAGRPEPQSATTIASPAQAAAQTLEIEPHSESGAIAIIGASGKFPKAENLAEFWQNIASGRDCIEEVPPSRWDIGRYYDPDPQAPGKAYCKWMGALDGIGRFDAGFFNITPLEAELTDPQQRMFLETAWHAIEDAAIDPVRLSGSRCSAFVSSGSSGYEDLIEEGNAYSLMGNSGSILAARISYLLDLRGASISVDTACSSSLVAIVQACESLLAGTCDMALAGGACVLIGPKMFIDTSKVSMLSANGRCFSFDERANGFVPGEGVGAVLLKRLEDAKRDGDPIRAIIRGWGTNQDGRTNGMTAPNPKAQTALIKSVYERFGIDPASIGLVECHGTGTPLGDPIEVEGLTDAFEGVPDGYSCQIGSVKSNIGHLLASAGIAGAMKAMLALENRQIPPSVNIETLNKHIPFSETPFAVSQSLKDWPETRDGAPRRVAVSAFGFSGTNAHLVLEEAGRTESLPTQDGPLVFVLTAKNKDRLIDYAGELERFITARPQLNLTALAATLQASRSGFDDRLAFVFTSREDLLRKLAAAAGGLSLKGVHFTSGDDAGSSAFKQDAEVQALAEKWLRSGDEQQLDKAAKLWADGTHPAWPDSGVPRINLPGYPFERTRYWAETSQTEGVETSTSVPTIGGPAWLGAQPAAGEIGQMTLQLSGAETFLTTHTSGEERLITGLLLPEMARSVLERLTGTRVTGLKHMLWGPPVTINGKPRDLTISVMSDPEGLLYRIDADGDDGQPCHFGSSLSGGSNEAEGTNLPAGQKLPGNDRTEAYRKFAERCSIHSGPPSPEAARVDRVVRDGEVLWAGLTSQPGSEAETKGMVFDPYVLDAVWRLLAFAGTEYSNDAGTSDALPFPVSVGTIIAFSPLSGQLTVKITAQTGFSNGVTVKVYNADGTESLRLTGVRLTALGKTPDFVIEESIPS